MTLKGWVKDEETAWINDIHCSIMYKRENLEIILNYNNIGASVLAHALDGNIIQPLKYLETFPHIKKTIKDSEI